MQRGAASGQITVLLNPRQSRTLSFNLDGTAFYECVLRYSSSIKFIEEGWKLKQFAVKGGYLGLCTISRASMKSKEVARKDCASKRQK
jgi:hypothetical protein